jgi:hypothetical protein
MDNPEIHTTMGTKHRTKAGNNNKKQYRKLKRWTTRKPPRTPE